MEDEITLDDLAAYDAFIEKMERAFNRYAGEVGIENAERYSLTEVCSKDVVFHWEETWASCGSEDHWQRMPLSYVLDYPKWQEEHEKAQAAKKAEEEREQAIQREAQKARDLRMLKELQARYPEVSE